ncbi:MAG: hybrid sensor histidine kinase/response regulator [Bacteroidota bacterium]
MKYFHGNIKFKLLVSYILLFVLTGVTLWLLYSVILGITLPEKGFEPSNKKLVYISSAITNLFEAESLGRTIIHSNERQKLSRYEKLMDSINTTIESLKYQFPHDSAQIYHIDSIQTLLTRKKENMRKLLFVQSVNNSRAMYQKDLLEMYRMADSISDDDKIINTTKGVQSDSIYIRDKNTGFSKKLAGLFSNQSDTNIRISITRLTQVDSIIRTAEGADSLGHLLKDLSGRMMILRDQLMRQEKELYENNLVITNQIREILSTFEEEEIRRNIEQVQSSILLINKTARIIVSFGVLAVSLIIVFVVMIMKDLSKSQRYRKQLEESKAYAESLLKTKEQFLLNVSHDIRAPIGSILGYTDLLKNTSNGSKQEHYLGNIKKSSSYILRLVEDLLDYSRLESGKLRIEQTRFNMKKLIEDTYGEFIPKAHAQELYYTYYVSEALNRDYRGDPHRIRQILSNLLSNAFKFTLRGSIELKADLVEFHREYQTVEISIKDTGIGIPKNKQKVIFDEFTRAGADVEKRFGGTGLGLTVAFRLARLMSGKIKVKSREGEGSTFSLVLPLESVKEVPGQTEPVKSLSRENDNNYQPGRALIIDDDDTHLLMMQETMIGIGFSVDTTHSGKEALEKTMDQEFDIIFCDIQIPDKSGFTLVREIRNQPGKNANKPIVALSAYNKAEQASYREAGFTTFIQKAFSREELQELLGRVVNPSVLSETVGTEKKSFDGFTTPSATPYNLDQIKQFVQNDQETLKTVVESFISSTRDNTERLRQCLGENKMAALKETAHKMLTMFRQFQMNAIVEKLSLIEKDGLYSCSREEAEQFVESIIDEIEHALQKLQNEPFLRE